MALLAGRRQALDEIRPAIALALIGIWLAAMPALAAESVDLELVLAIDTSRSIDEYEARLQREGVAAALRHPNTIRAILGGYHKNIAAAYIDYSSVDFNEIIVDWRIINDRDSAAAFAAALIDTPLTFGRRTSISARLEMAANLIE